MPGSTNTRAVTVAVMTATFLAALDSTVVGTAMPTVIGALGGLDLYSWAFSAYLLTSTTVVPLCGRLADMHGRKPVFLAGAVLFLAGSALCGAATSMQWLILFRAIQGLGAGAVLPASITVVGDIFQVEERARVQGLLSSVWGVSAIIGPAIGGLIVDRLDWRWVFFVNLPFGIVSMVLFSVFLHERVTSKRHRVNFAGTALLTVGVTTLLLGLLEAGQSGAALPAPPAALIAVAVLLLLLFLQRESHAEEPLLPLNLFKTRVVAVSNAAGFLAGATLLGVSSFIPPFVQGVLGGTAINAGSTLTPMSIGWPVGSTLSGRLIMRHGYRPVVVLGTALIALGSLLLLPIWASTPQPFIMLAMSVLGLGMGLTTTSFLVAVQSSVGWGERGIATASTQFFRTIGGAVGVAAMGTLMSREMHLRLQAGAQAHPETVDVPLGVSSASIILDPVARATLPAPALEAIRLALASSLHSVYVAVALVAVAAFALTVLLFPARSAAQHARQARAPAESARPRRGDAGR